VLDPDLARDPDRPDHGASDGMMEKRGWDREMGFRTAAAPRSILKM
jgi:hypothetical protein